MSTEDEIRYEAMRLHCLSDHGVIIKSADLATLTMFEHPAIHKREHDALEEHHATLPQHVGVPHPED